LLFIFSSVDYQLQYADREALDCFKLAGVGGFFLFDIHPDLNNDSFKCELRELFDKQRGPVERLLKFSQLKAAPFTARFRFSPVSLGGHDFIEVAGEEGLLKNAPADSDPELLYNAQQRLLVSEKTMATIIDLAVDGVVIIDDRGLIQGFNRAAEKMFGFSSFEAIGQNVAMLAPEPHRSKHDSYIRRFLDTRIPHIVGIGREIDAQRKNGELFPIDLAVGEVRLAEGSLFTGFIRDLSENRKLISERNSFFQMSLDLFCILDFDGFIRRVNAQWFDGMGYEPEELHGQHINTIINPEDLAADEHLLADILGGRNVFGRVMRLKHKSGEWRWMLLNSTVDRANKAIYGVSRDITEQKSMLEELQRAKAEAERSSQTRGVFIANMSHEFRTPLNSIIGFSRHLQKNLESRFSPRETLYLDRITRNGETLLQMVNNVLNFSRSENSQLEAEFSKIILPELLSEVIDLMQVLIEEKQISLNLVIPENSQPVISDIVKLRQIVQNIVDNAIKFSEGEPVTVELIVDSENRPLRIDVSDSGPGIAEEKLKLIFEAFQQVDTRVARKYGGAGLGLAIARSFADLIGVKITVKSSPGQGSCFSIHFSAQETKP